MVRHGLAHPDGNPLPGLDAVHPFSDVRAGVDEGFVAVVGLNGVIGTHRQGHAGLGGLEPQDHALVGVPVQLGFEHPFGELA